MRDFEFKLERYSEHTGQSINWLRGNINFYLPCLLIVHIIAIFFVFPMFTTDIYSVSLYIYAGVVLLTGLAAMITGIRVLTVGYYSIIAFSLLNAIRCTIIASALIYSIIVSILNPPVNEADAHMPITFVAILFLIVIAIEVTECSIHIANIVYIRKRKKLFEK